MKRAIVHTHQKADTTQSEDTISNNTLVGSCLCNVLSIVFIPERLMTIKQNNQRTNGFISLR